jgi:hypothetical protein
MSKKKVLWSLLTIMMVAMLSVGFASCSDSDENEPEQSTPQSTSQGSDSVTPYDTLSVDEKMIVGAWDPDGIDERWDSYGKWIFLADHTCEYYFTEKDRYGYFYDCYYDYREITEKKTGVWIYNSQTKQLTTTINGTYWIISLMTNDAWTGTSANYGAVTYKRNNIEFANYYLRKFGLISSNNYYEFNLKDDVLKAEEDAAPELYKDVRKTGGNPDYNYYEYSFRSSYGSYDTFPSRSDGYIIDDGFNVTNLTSTEIQCKIGLGKYYGEERIKYQRQDHGYWVDKDGNYTENIYDPYNTFIYDYDEESFSINPVYVGYFNGTITLTNYYTANPKLVFDGQTMQTKKPYKKEISLTGK